MNVEVREHVFCHSISGSGILEGLDPQTLAWMVGVNYELGNQTRQAASLFFQTPFGEIEVTIPSPSSCDN